MEKGCGELRTAYSDGMDFFTFAKRVETEESALRFACELKLVREGPPPCPRCNAAMKWERGIRRRGVNGVWRCRNKAHTRTSRSLLHGSVFAQLQVPVSSFLKTVFFIAQDMTVDEIVANVHISRPTVIKIHKKLRDLMQQYNTTHKRLIGGVGMVVETDECHIHSRKYGVGRQEASEAWWVVGGICRQTHEMFVVVVEARDKDTLTKAVFENVRAGTTIYTDCWRGYCKLRQPDLGYTHKKVNHSKNFVNPDDPDVYTNTVERAWRTLRENIPLQAGLDNVESYIQKFLFFRHAGCTNSISKFNAMIELCRRSYPII